MNYFLVAVVLLLMIPGVPILPTMCRKERLSIHQCEIRSTASLQLYNLMARFFRIALLSTLFAGCLFNEDNPASTCPIDTTVLAFVDPSVIEGTWKRFAGRTLQCAEDQLEDPVFRIEITQDSVFIRDGFYDISGTNAFELMRGVGVFGRPFLQFDFHILFLTPGDTLILDSTRLDGAQVFFEREIESTQ